MKIYIKESKQLSVKKVLPIFSDSVSIQPLVSLDNVSYQDIIMISQCDSDFISQLNEYHVVVYEEFFEEFSTRIHQAYYDNHDYFYLKNALQAAKDPTVSTLVSGSSYGAFGIELAYMDHAINLSAISQDLYYSQKLLYQACESNKNIKNIVLCVGHYCFFSDLSLTKNPAELQRISKVYYPLLRDSHNCLILPPKADYSMQNSNIDFENILNRFATNDYQQGFFNEKRPRSHCATVVWEAYTKSWRELSKEEKENAGRTRAESHNKIIHHTASFNENIGLFQEFVHFCNVRHINLLLTVMPASSYYLKYLTPEYKDIFILSLTI